MASSLFFNAALSGPWKESGGKVCLTDHDPSLFNVYLQFLYTSKIHSSAADDVKENGEDREWDRLIGLYLMGDHFVDAKLMNASVDAMIDKWKTGKRWPLGYAHRIYENTMTGSPLRRLIVDFHVHLGVGMALARSSQQESDAPKEFFIDAITEFAKVGAALFEKDTPEPWDVDQCRYHVHATGQCAHVTAV